MSTDPTPPSDATEGAARPDGTLAATLARPEGTPSPFPGTIEAAFAPPARPDEVGTFARYRVLKKLGQGGMGAVFLGYDAALERKVALKVMLPQFAADTDARERFLREARSAAKVKSDHVVVIYEVGQERAVPFIAMEYLLGAPLDQYLKTRGELPLPHALRVCREVALGLAAVHELGLIHRDIKPGNIWLEAPKGRAKLLDFGLARAEQDDVNLTGTGAVVGTISYMSPEQGRGDKVDHRSDLFSLGVMLYRLCTGHMPFKGTSAMALLTSLAVDAPPAPRTLNPNLPAALDAVLMKMLAKNPDERYQTAPEVADLLLAVGRGATTGSAPVVAIPLTVGAQTQNVWDGIDDSASVAVPLSDGATEVGSVAPATPARRAAPRAPARDVSLRPVLLAAGVLVAAVAVLAVVLWPRTKPETAQAEPDKPGGDPKAPKPAPDADRKAASWVLAKGGLVVITAGGERRGLKKGDPLPAEPFAVEALDLAGLKAVTDGDLKDLPQLKHLVELDLSGTGVSDAGMSHVGRCTSLQWLALARTEVRDAGVAELKSCKDLVFLDISSIRGITIASFHALEGLEKLAVFDARGADIGIRGHGEIRNKRPALIVDPPRRAAEAVLALGGEVRAGDPKRITAKGEVPVNQFTLTHAAIDTRTLTREQLAPALGLLRWCKDLTGLALTGPNVTDADLAPFKSARNLTQLTLTGAPVGDAGLAHVRACVRLDTVHLEGTKVTDAGLAHLKDCKELKVLALQNTAVTDAGLDHLRTGTMTLLDLRETSVTGDKVADLRRSRPGCKIEWDRPKFDDRAAMKAALALGGKVEHQIDAVRATVLVTGLFAERAPWTDDTLSRFAGCKTLRWANLCGTKVTDACLAHLTDSKGMSGLLLADTKVADAGLVHLKHITGLRTLQLDGTGVTDAGLGALAECKQLTALDLKRTTVTAKGVAELRKALPGCKISWDGGTDREVAEWVISVGGKVLVNTTDTNAFITSAPDLPKGDLQLTGVSLLSNTSATDANLARLAQCPNIISLNLASTPVTDDGLAAFKNHVKLQVLYLDKTAIGDKGAAHLAGCKQLRRLGLFQTKVTDAGLAHFTGCKDLNYLHLMDTATTDTGLAHFKGCDKLASVYLERTKVTDAGLTLFKDHKSIWLLTLSGAPVTDAGLDHLTRCPQLRTLNLRDTKVTAKGVGELAKALPQCKIDWDGPKK